MTVETLALRRHLVALALLVAEIGEPTAMHLAVRQRLLILLEREGYER